ncbi:MAG: nucleotidyltransferase domain-containing protein [Planctomycetota bacterium]
MSERPDPSSTTASSSPVLLLPVGTQVVTRVAIDSATAGRHPAGAVGVVVAQPVSPAHRYRVKFPDGSEAPLHRDDLAIRKHLVSDDLAGDTAADRDELWSRIIYRCVVGSRAYGLDHDGSDVDRRGIFVASADRDWSLIDVPGQLENDATQECYWELRKFLLLALKANPAVLECLYTPLVELANEHARELRAMRAAFLSRLVYQTYNGYVMGQFKKLEGDVRRHARDGGDPATPAIKWKHAMHLIRLLLSGIAVLEHGDIVLRVDSHRQQLLAIRRGEVPWPDVDAWRLDLHRQFDRAFERTTLPERPDYDRADAFLRKVRRATADADRPVRRVGAAPTSPPAPAGLSAGELHALGELCDAHAQPVVFATVSGAHLYGFASPDSDWDLRGMHLLPPALALRLEPGPLTIEQDGGHAAGRPLDIVTHDASKFIAMLLRKNGYVLEQLLSPLVVRTGPAHDELRALAPACITRHHVHHYRGFADSQWKLVVAEPAGARVKPLLYVYRVLLTGIHLMRSGRVVCDLPRLAREVVAAHDRPPGLDDLMAAKVTGREDVRLDEVSGAASLDVHDACRRRLGAMLDEASRSSDLPEAPGARPALDDLLVRMRLA